MIQKHQWLNKEAYLGESKKKNIWEGKIPKAAESDKKFILKSTNHDFVNSSRIEGVED